MPEQVLLLFREIVVGFKDRKVVGGTLAYEFVLPLTHLLSTPTEDGTIIDAKRSVGDDEFLINAYNAPEAFALRASPNGRIEGEHIVGRLLEGDAIFLETRGEGVHNLS